MSGIVSNSYKDYYGEIEYALDPSHGQADLTFANNSVTVDVNGQTATVSYANGVSTISDDGKATTVTSLTSPKESDPGIRLSTRAPDSISLSAAAQSWLSNDQIALDLISRSKSETSTKSTSTPDVGKQATAAQNPPSQSGTSQAVADPATNGPSTVLSIATLIAQAQIQQEDPKYIYEKLASEGGIGNLVSSFRASGLSEDYINSFEKAYDNQSFTVQATDDLPGVIIAGSETVGSQGENVTGGSQNGMYQAEQAAEQSGLYCFDAGDVFLTWPQNTATS